MRVETMLQKEKDGELFKDTKLAHVMRLGCLDELLKIAGEGSPVGVLVNQEEPSMEGPQQLGQKKQQFPSASSAIPFHDPPAPPEDTPPPDIHESQAPKLAEVGYGEASVALKKLQKLEAEAPTGGELARNALAGAMVGPVMGTVSQLVAGRQPLQEALGAFREGLPGAAKTYRGAWAKGLKGTGRGMAASALSGSVLGAGMPLVRGYLHREAEKEKLRDYLGESPRGKLRGKIKQELGV